jgi:hypothetical protein
MEFSCRTVLSCTLCGIWQQNFVQSSIQLVATTAVFIFLSISYYNVQYRAVHR